MLREVRIRKKTGNPDVLLLPPGVSTHEALHVLGVPHRDMTYDVRYGEPAGPVAQSSEVRGVGPPVPSREAKEGEAMKAENLHRLNRLATSSPTIWAAIEQLRLRSPPPHQTEDLLVEALAYLAAQNDALTKAMTSMVANAPLPPFRVGG